SFSFLMGGEGFSGTVALAIAADFRAKIDLPEKFAADAHLARIEPIAFAYRHSLNTFRYRWRCFRLDRWNGGKRRHLLIGMYLGDARALPNRVQARLFFLLPKFSLEHIQG